MQNLLKDNIKQLREYCRAYKVKELYAVGSVNTDCFDEKSDIDLLISFDDIPIDEYTDNYFILHELFEGVFKRRVDLITDRSLSNPYFIKSINKNKRLLYGR